MLNWLCRVCHKHPCWFCTHYGCAILKATWQALWFLLQLLIDMAFKDLFKACHRNTAEISMHKMYLKYTGANIGLYYKHEMLTYPDTQYAKPIIPIHHHLIATGQVHTNVLNLTRQPGATQIFCNKLRKECFISFYNYVPFSRRTYNHNLPLT